MSETSRRRDHPRQGSVLSANERLKAGWDGRLAWSVIVAVLLHAALFLLRPGWDFPRLEATRERGPAGAEWLVATDLASASGGSPAVALAVGEPSDSTRDDAPSASGVDGATDGTTGADGDGTSSRALRERLGDVGDPALAAGESPRRAPPEPRPSPAEESEPESPRARRDGENGSSLTIGGRAATAEVTDEPDEGTPDLERLRSLDPDVVVGLGSSEVLLRNPGEVVRYKETMARRHPEVATIEAWVSVAIWVDEDGSVEWAEVSDSSGREVLDEAALTLFADVVAFRPAREGGDRVPKSMLFYLLFPW